MFALEVPARADVHIAPNATTPGVASMELTASTEEDTKPIIPGATAK